MSSQGGRAISPKPCAWGEHSQEEIPNTPPSSSIQRKVALLAQALWPEQLFSSYQKHHSWEPARNEVPIWVGKGKELVEWGEEELLHPLTALEGKEETWPWSWGTLDRSMEPKGRAGLLGEREVVCLLLSFRQYPCPFLNSPQQFTALKWPMAGHGQDKSRLSFPGCPGLLHR